MRARIGARAIGMATAAAGLVLGTLASFGPVRAQEEDEGEAQRHRHVEVHPRAMVASMGGGYLGVRLEDVDAEDVRELGLPEERGAKVVEVAGDTPAEAAGLSDGDVIVAWNGSPVESVAELRRHVRETPAGRSVRLEVLRDGARRDVTVELGHREDAMAFRFGPGSEWHGNLMERMGDLREHLRGFDLEGPHLDGPMMIYIGHGRMGVGLMNLGEQLGEYFGLGERTGVLVTRVEEDSPAATAGLRAGDVILSIDGREVEDPGDASRIVRRAEAGPVEVRILREGTERTVTVELGEREEESGRRGWVPGPSLAPAVRVRAAPVQVRFDGGVDGLLPTGFRVVPGLPWVLPRARTAHVYY